MFLCVRQTSLTSQKLGLSYSEPPSMAEPCSQYCFRAEGIVYWQHFLVYIGAHRPRTVPRKVHLWLVLRVYTTASIFLSSVCWFSSLPNLYVRSSGQRSIYCGFPRESENDLSLPFAWTHFFCLEQRQLRMAFLVIYSQGLTF